MNISMNNHHHYITVDAQGLITSGWSDGPRPEKDTAGAVCINEAGEYQFRLTVDGKLNPVLRTMDGIPLYKWDGQQVQARTEEEIEADRVALPAAPPTREERLDEIESAMSGVASVIANVDYLSMMTGIDLPETEEGIVNG